MDSGAPNLGSHAAVEVAQGALGAATARPCSRAVAARQLTLRVPTHTTLPPVMEEQQQTGSAESNINSKIDPKEHWVLRCGRFACIETFGGVPDFATSWRTDPGCCCSQRGSLEKRRDCWKNCA